MKKYLSFFAAALLLAACQSDDIVDQNGVAPKGSIQFALAETKELTRTPGSTVGIIGEDAATKERSISVYGFGVFGCYTGSSVYENTTVTPDFMYNQEVKLKKDGDIYKGTYEPVKYWPNTGKTTFFAYAPYVNKNKIDYEKPYKSHCIAGMSEPYDEGDPWLIYVLAPKPFDNVTGQKDLLIGGCEIEESGNKYVNPWYDMEKPNLNSDPDPMKFTFYHALGLIGDKIKIQMTSELQAQLDGDHNAKVYIDHIDMKFKNLTRKAKLILNSKQNDPNWKPIVSGEVTTTREYTITHQDIVNANSQYEPSADSDFDQKWYKNDADHNGVKETDGVVELLTKKGLLFIPYQVADDPQQVEVTVYYQVLAAGMEPFNGQAKSITNLLNENGTVSDILITLGKGLKYDKIYAPKVGDVYFSDGTWGNNEHAYGAVPIGAVCYIGNDIKRKDGSMAPHGLVMALEDARIPYMDWTDKVHDPYDFNRRAVRFSLGNSFNYPYCSDFASAYDDVEGESHSEVIYNQWISDADNFGFPQYNAGYVAYMYETPGVGARGNWHLGSFGEWIRIFDASIATSMPSYTDKNFSTMISEGSLTSSILYLPTLDTDEERLIRSTKNPRYGISNWIYHAASYYAADGHSRPYDLLGSECMYWTSTMCSQYYTYTFRTRYEQQDIQFFGDGYDRSRVEQTWYAGENFRVRPLMTF